MIYISSEQHLVKLRKVFMESKQWFCRGSTIPLKAAIIAAIISTSELL